MDLGKKRDIIQNKKFISQNKIAIISITETIFETVRENN